MSVIIFECKNCGTCCRNLIEDVNGISNGLFLTPRETRLFPSEMVSPQVAIGLRKPENIISYQLNVNICPHIAEGNKCVIYDKRPLACKSFPIEITPLKTTASVKCTVIGSQMKEGEFREIDFSRIEFEASQKLVRYLWNRYQKYSKVGSKTWKFDLKTKKWIVKKKGYREILQKNE